MKPSTEDVVDCIESIDVARDKKPFQKKVFRADRYTEFGLPRRPTKYFKTILNPIGIFLLLVSNINVCHRRDSGRAVPCGLGSITPGQVRACYCTISDGCD